MERGGDGRLRATKDFISRMARGGGGGGCGGVGGCREAKNYCPSPLLPFVKGSLVHLLVMCFMQTLHLGSEVLGF